MYSLDCRHAVLSPRMPVDSYRQRTAVLVFSPTADSWDVHAGLNARGRKEMPKILLRELRIAQRAAARLQAISCAVLGTDAFAGLWVACGV
jgi:hypothetical protein